MKNGVFKRLCYILWMILFLFVGVPVLFVFAVIFKLVITPLMDLIQYVLTGEARNWELIGENEKVWSIRFDPFRKLFP